MPSTTPTRPTRCAARAAAVKLDHHVAKTHSRQAIRAERRVGRAPETGAAVHRALEAAAPPALVPAMRIVGDIVWTNVPDGKMSFEDRLRAMCDGESVSSETTFYFQCAPGGEGMADGMEAIVNKDIDASYDEEIGWFPAPFHKAIEAVESASTWSIESVDTFCGGLLLCDMKKAMPVASAVTLNINSTGPSTVIIPYDTACFSDLYDAAAAGNFVKSARKTE